MSSSFALRIGRWFSLVRFSHSIFALPFALAGAWLAARGRPSWQTLGWIVLAAVAARTCAMAFNRWLDAEIDAQNPRTRSREIPSGALPRTSVVLLALLAAAVFVACSFAINRLCGWLAFPVLAVLCGYSATKRFTSGAHLVLGLALGLAPLGAWLAVRGDFAGDLWIPIALAGAVLAWVAGFDLIYAAQDVEFDRRAGLHSIPARFGVANALRLSRGLHVVTVGLLGVVGWRAELGVVYFGALLVVAALLAWEQSLVRADDLSQVDLAFFTINGWVGVLYFAGLAVDLGLEAI
ncbi:MAG: putative 4-hydroxybenzoate polyprenyltransferase [Planctomycetes bacterium]|nr:putative 4-hydroxybenzoate polyprenyltransferase [Planctomycetota bacterium]